MTTTDTPAPRDTVPGVSQDAAGDVATTLQDRLVSLLDLTLTLKHILWERSSDPSSSGPAPADQRIASEG